MTRLLERYITKIILLSIGLITLMLAGLQIFILFVNQLEELGRMHYGILEATAFVFLQMPYQVYLFFPMASLLGALVGLGMMANHRELVVMRASGLSIFQISMVVFKASLIVIILMTVIGETIVPKLSTMGNELKFKALNSSHALRTARGIWIREGHDFIHIGEISPNNQLLNVQQFHFDTTQSHLLYARTIESIVPIDKGWMAYKVAETDFKPNAVSAQQFERLPWEVPLNPKLLQQGHKEADEMTLQELKAYLKLQINMGKSNASNYPYTYWQRLIQPLTTLVMMMLAIPFIFGPLRSSTMGSKFLAGATVGFGFHLMNRFFGPLTQVWQWPPELAAIAPTVLCALLGCYLMKRVS